MVVHLEYSQLLFNTMVHGVMQNWGLIATESYAN